MCSNIHFIKECVEKYEDTGSRYFVLYWIRNIEEFTPKVKQPNNVKGGFKRTCHSKTMFEVIT